MFTTVLLLNLAFQISNKTRRMSTNYTVHMLFVLNNF
jgi:hypothetical protein